ncbi:MAG: FtsX-like permease family protein [Deltaproteobacteria bacterium]|nr:FtsX-like permease family protein [Deltaproteobacteria bacterium]
MAAAGMGFAILVIFVQLGFYSSVLNTALAVSSRLNGELILISPRFVHLSEAGEIPRARLFQVLAHPKVLSATPIYFRYVVSRDSATGNYCRLFALGFPLADARTAMPLRIPGIDDQLDALRPTGDVLMDRFTQTRCGPSSPESQFELMGTAARVVGRFELGVGFLADGAIVASDDSFGRYFSKLGYSLDRPHLGLIKLAAGSDPAKVAAGLRERLPSDVRVITREELDAYQHRHWVQNTAVGNIFGMGTVAGFLVGVVVLFQILSTDIRNHLPLYATLRAMGYTSQRLHGYVLEQSWIFAVLGYAPALLLTLILFPIIHNVTLLPIFMTGKLAAGVLVLSFIMCTVASMLSSRRLRRADPAELF